MRKYSLATVALSTFFAFQGQAEFKFGALGGGNYSTWTTGSSVSIDLAGSGDPYVGSLGPSGGFGYQLGGIARYEKNDWGIEANLIYSSRTAKWHGSVANTTDSARLSYEVTMKQIQLPIMGVYKFELAEKAHFRFNLGLFASYGIGKLDVDVKASDVPGTVQTSSGKYTWAEVGLRKLNFGGVGGAGVDFTLEGGSRIGAEVRAQSTFSDMKDTLSPAIGLGGDKVGLGSIDLLVSYIF